MVLNTPPAPLNSINVDQFTQFVRTHPALLFPAFELQTNIQTRILGGDFWNEKSETRLKLSSGEYVSINQILKAHINKAAFDSLVMSNQVVNAMASREDSMVKEQIKGALRTSGLSGERRFKKSKERSMIEMAKRKISSELDHDFDVSPTEVSPKKEKSKGKHGGEARSGNPEARARLKNSINAVKAANSFKIVTSAEMRRESGRKRSKGGSGRKSFQEKKP